MNVATLAAALIASWEGLELEAYQDVAKVWTIGFGHTAGVKEGDKCTLVDARAWLSADCAPLFDLVTGLPMVAAAAYVSFGYNCGKASLEHVLAGRAQIMEFIHSGSYVEQGLVMRRAAEQALIESVTPIST